MKKEQLWVRLSTKSIFDNLNNSLTIKNNVVALNIKLNVIKAQGIELKFYVKNEGNRNNRHNSLFQNEIKKSLIETIISQ